MRELIFLNLKGKCNSKISLIDFKLLRVFFYFKEYPDDKKKGVNLMAFKPRKYASLRWENLKKEKAHEGRSKIKYWKKMKREINKRFLSEHYRLENFMRQSRLVVEEYTMKFELFMLKCDIVEPNEQIIA
jgi:hypothetical protein